VPGIKETKEVLVVGFAVAEVLATLLKDGVQVKDALALLDLVFTDAAFLEKVKFAVEGSALIPAELADVSVFEGLELGKFALDGIKKIGVILQG